MCHLKGMRPSPLSPHPHPHAPLSHTLPKVTMEYTSPGTYSERAETHSTSESFWPFLSLCMCARLNWYVTIVFCSILILYNIYSIVFFISTVSALFYFSTTSTVLSSIMFYFCSNSFVFHVYLINKVIKTQAKLYVNTM